MILPKFLNKFWMLLLETTWLSRLIHTLIFLSTWQRFIMPLKMNGIVCETRLGKFIFGSNASRFSNVLFTKLSTHVYKTRTFKILSFFDLHPLWYFHIPLIIEMLTQSPPTWKTWYHIKLSNMTLNTHLMSNTNH